MLGFPFNFVCWGKDLTVDTFLLQLNQLIFHELLPRGCELRRAWGFNGFGSGDAKTSDWTREKKKKRETHPVLFFLCQKWGGKKSHSIAEHLQQHRSYSVVYCFTTKSRQQTLPQTVFSLKRRVYVCVRRHRQRPSSSLQFEWDCGGGGGGVGDKLHTPVKWVEAKSNIGS